MIESTLLDVPEVKARGRHPRDLQDHILFEFCYELGRQVGGIYTVLKSKSDFTRREYGDRFTMVGPLVHQSASIEIQKLEPPTPELAAAIHSMEKRGIKMLYGRWYVEGSPRILLIDPETGSQHLDEWKEEFSRITGVPLPFPEDDELVDGSLIFGFLVAMFLEEYMRHETRRAVIAHFHEWPAAMALPLIRDRKIDLTTIFTCHATLLGRELIKKGIDFYNILETLDVDKEGRECDHYHWHLLETTAAQSAHVFTTVSEITAQESEFLLKRKPDGVLPNGLNIAEISIKNESEYIRRMARSKIRDFVRSHFYGHLDFNLEKTLYMFIAGRYEFRNKGADIFIESMARLNEKLKAEGSDTTIVSFMIMPAKTTSVKNETLQGQAVLKSLHDHIRGIQRTISEKLFEKALCWKEGDPLPTKEDYVTDEENVDFQRLLHNIQRKELPPLVTHNLEDSENDAILTRLREVGLLNRSSDRVKIVFYPSFLKASDPVFPINYHEFIRGTHMGIFPSMYEPWGYTPGECTAMGVPSITTNVSGFGLYMEQLLDDHAPDYGVYVINRRTQDFESAADQMTEYLHQFSQMSRRERAAQRHLTQDLSELLDWELLNVEYGKARQVALRKVYERGFTADQEEDIWGSAPGVWSKVRRPSAVSTSPAMTDFAGRDRRSSSVFSRSPFRGAPQSNTCSPVRAGFRLPFAQSPVRQGKRKSISSLAPNAEITNGVQKLSIDGEPPLSS